MTEAWPPGDDGEYKDLKWVCLCSCSRCGPMDAHDCGTRACLAGWYENLNSC